MLIWIILFSILGSVGAILSAGALLLFNDKVQNTLIPCLISYATGTLLSAAFLGMIPHAIGYANENITVIEQVNQNISFILATVLMGVVVFFVLEKLIIWRHCHVTNCEVHGAPGPIILIGDSFHNLIDGIIIASSFLINFAMGIAVSLSVIAHEVPQEVGDFGILLDQDYSKKKALFYNTLSGSSTIPAAIISYFILDIVRTAIPYILAFSAASFIYIALADLYPELQHRNIELKHTLRQFLLMMAGIGTMILVFQVHI